MNIKRIARILNCISLLLASVLVNAGQHALLVGVSDYTDPRIPDLEGPVNDVQALREVLIANWQFDDADITVLLDAQASEAAILNAIDELNDTTVSGDDIIIYFSGHGTSAADPDLGARLNLPDGSGAVVGSDFNPSKLNRKGLSKPAQDGLLIGRFEIRPRLQALDRDRNVLVIFDACFSGNATREVASVFKPVNKRQIDLADYLPLPTQTQAATSASHDDHSSAQKTRSVTIDTSEEFRYRNTVYFGAAAEDQYAVDLSMAEIDAGLVSTIDGKAHGGFSDSLLRALWALPDSSSTISFVQLFNRTVNHFNAWCKSCGHTPVSLPAADAFDNELLGRTILTPSLLLAGNDSYNPSAEPALQDALVIDTQQLNNTELAQRRLLPQSFNDKQAPFKTASPDVFFTQLNNQINAYASDGHLIAQLPADISDESIQQWLTGRQWLKRRMARDVNRENGDLHVSFRHPLASNRVREGEYVHFNVISKAPANLVVLLLDARSELSLLYPVNDNERQSVLPALQSQRIPRQDEPKIRVTPPWGTDTVIFYTLPTTHTLQSVLQQLATLTTIPTTHPALTAFEASLERNDFRYSAMTIRVIAAP